MLQFLVVLFSVYYLQLMSMQNQLDEFYFTCFRITTLFRGTFHQGLESTCESLKQTAMKKMLHSV
ncbi:unnamed protein product [Schistosoma margrebowiei]|uniref:Uncharacterized protein n=1 Tax=Schistosoma margrebowiei TaxID=48269 RepID=A0A3P7YVH0_9TREM|nr:unnamed protein product [Schistosoma margrebowiei]